MVSAQAICEGPMARFPASIPATRHPGSPRGSRCVAGVRRRRRTPRNIFISSRRAIAGTERRSSGCGAGCSSAALRAARKVVAGGQADRRSGAAAAAADAAARGSQAGLAALRGPSTGDRQSPARRDRARRSRPRSHSHRRGDAAQRAADPVLHDLRERSRGADPGSTPCRSRAPAARANGGGRPACRSRPPWALHCAVARGDSGATALGTRPLRWFCRDQQPYGQQIHSRRARNGAGHRRAARPRSDVSRFADLAVQCGPSSSDCLRGAARGPRRVS